MTGRDNGGSQPLDRLYDVYLTTYEKAEEALHRSDEGLLRSICLDASAREGTDSVVTQLALSDAEGGRAMRTRLEVIGMVCHQLDR